MFDNVDSVLEQDPTKVFTVIYNDEFHIQLYRSKNLKTIKRVKILPRRHGFCRQLYPYTTGAGIFGFEVFSIENPTKRKIKSEISELVSLAFDEAENGYTYKMLFYLECADQLAKVIKSTLPKLNFSDEYIKNMTILGFENFFDKLKDFVENAAKHGHSDWYQKYLKEAQANAKVFNRLHPKSDLANQSIKNLIAMKPKANNGTLEALQL